MDPKGGGAAKKRGPGRPPKIQKPPVLEMRGIVAEPDDPNNRVELVYEDPTIFKKIFTYFKNIKADRLYLLFNPAGMTIFTYDLTRQSRVVVGFPGDSLNHYYCSKGSYLKSIRRDTVNNDFLTIDKSFYKISIESRIDTPDMIRITFKDHAIDKECVSKVDVENHTTPPEEDKNLFVARALTVKRALDEAPVTFQLTSRQFKKTVGDAAKRQAASIVVEKLGDCPLQIVYAREGHSYNEIYRSGEKIAMRSTIGPNDLMRCSLGIGGIKSLAQAMVADDVVIHCYSDGSDRDAVFMSYVGGVAGGEDAGGGADAGESRGNITIGTVVNAYTT